MASYSAERFAPQTTALIVVGLLNVLTHVVPRVAVASGVPGITPTDNMAALRRMSRDPLTIRETRVDTSRGLVDLMDDALAAASRLGPGKGGNAGA